MVKHVVETLAVVDIQNHPAKPWCGIVLQGPADADRDLDRVIEAAPFVRSTLKNRSRRDVRRIAQERGWRIQVVYQMERHLP